MNLETGSGKSLPVIFANDLSTGFPNKVFQTEFQTNWLIIQEQFYRFSYICKSQAESQSGQQLDRTVITIRRKLYACDWWWVEPFDPAWLANNSSLVARLCGLGEEFLVSIWSCPPILTEWEISIG